MEKFKFVDEVIKQQGLSRQEVIEYWSKNPINEKKVIEEISVCAGFYWYEDNTFSSEKVVEKKVKALVELVSDGFIYGDLTASELFYITEKCCNWFDAKKYVERFSYAWWKG